MKHVAMLGCWWLYMLCSDGINNLNLLCAFVTVFAQTYQTHHTRTKRWVNMARFAQKNTQWPGATLSATRRLRSPEGDGTTCCSNRQPSRHTGTGICASYIDREKGAQKQWSYILNLITSRTWEINLITTSRVSRIFWPLCKCYRWGLSPSTHKVHGHLL
jgi:hypothetical protein